MTSQPDRSQEPAGGPPESRSGISRRTLLTGLAGLGGGATLLAGAWWGTQAADVTLTGPGGLFDGGDQPGAGAPSALPRPASATTLPAGVEVGVDGVAPFRVPNEDFFQIDTAFGLPKLNAQDWQLRIHGMVDREMTLDYATLLEGELIERDITLCCVSNEVGGDLVGNAVWLGLPLAPLLRGTGPSAGADMVLSTSADGWTASSPLQALTDDDRDAMLAIGMNGEVLPARHGFPVRMVVPGLYGFVSATKWVVDLEVTRFDAKKAYWSTRGWSERGPVKLASRIDVPRSGANLSPGQVAVAGVAWAPGIGIDAVEVSVDGGGWQPARLAETSGLDSWRQWVFPWTATIGRHELKVRATDGAALAQTGERSRVDPDGATGWHTIEVTVR